MSGHKRLKMHHEKKAKGGKINEYNAVGAPEVKEAENKKPGFKSGGKAEGKKAHKRLDKRARGGAMKKCAAGGSPFTAAAKRTTYLNKGAGEGHENDGPRGEDKQSDVEC